jgi:hypothetical protein
MANPHPLRMPVPASRPDETAAVTRGAMRCLHALGHACLREVPLPNGRRADILALGRGGEILIVEVKSGIDDWRADAKWPDYRPFCDGLLFAVAPHFPVEILPPEAGLVLADAFGGEIVRPGLREPLAAARRKAMTMLAARLAAERLHLMLDPEAAFPD